MTWMLSAKFCNFPTVIKTKNNDVSTAVTHLTQVCMN